MKLLLLIISLAGAAVYGQEPTAERGRAHPEWDRLTQFFEEQRLAASRTPWVKQILERQAAEEQRREFIRKANHFVQLWNRVMLQYRNGVLNVKDARELSKAFRALEKSGLGK